MSYVQIVENSKLALDYVVHAQAFVRWLNRDFEPGGSLCVGLSGETGRNGHEYGG
jgi:hypothetical protein